MNTEDLIDKYRINDISAEIDNELNGMFVEILGDDFELGIFTEYNPNNDDTFILTVEITCKNATLSSEKVKQIKSSVEERLSHNLGDGWKAVKKKFDGVQVILNEAIVS